MKEEKMTAQPEDTCTMAEAAQYLHVWYRTIIKYVRERKLEAQKVGRRVYVSKKSLRELKKEINLKRTRASERK